MKKVLLTEREYIALKHLRMNESKKSDIDSIWSSIVSRFFSIKQLNREDFDQFPEKDDENAMFYDDGDVTLALPYIPDIEGNTDNDDGIDEEASEKAFSGFIPFAKKELAKNGLILRNVQLEFSTLDDCVLSGHIVKNQANFS